MTEPERTNPTALPAAEVGPSWGRRRFLRTLVLCGGGMLLPRHARAVDWWPPGGGVLRIGVILPASPTDQLQGVLRGAELGVSEAERVGQAMGWRLELHRIEPGAEKSQTSRPAVDALLAGIGTDSCATLGDLADDAAVPVLNVGCTDDALRENRCGPFLFHVTASDAMRADARAAYRGGIPREEVRAVGWHPSLERFGAAQLNDRFRARFGMEMSEASWAGWMAVKLLWEAALRSGSAEPGAVAGYLAGERTHFDGHRGWPLSFRAWDHQLRQPLYLVAGDGAGRLVGEVPVRTASGGSTSRDQLDRLGAARSTTCQHHAEVGK